MERRLDKCGLERWFSSGEHSQNLGSVSSTHNAVHNCMLLQLQEIQCPLLISMDGHQAHKINKSKERKETIK